MAAIVFVGGLDRVVTGICLAHHTFLPERSGVQAQIVSEHRIYSENSVDKDPEQDPE